MNFPPPQWIKDAADVALNTVAGNHYSHPKGRIRLREAIRDHYSESFNRTLDVEDEILVSSGANEGTALSNDSGEHVDSHRSQASTPCGSLS